MKNKIARIFVSLALTLGIVGTANVSSEASSIFVATVRVADVNGKPIPNTELVVSSESAKGVALGVTVVTNSKGEARAQVYPGQYRLYVSLGDRCFLPPGLISGSVDKSNPLILLETPPLRDYKFKLVSEAGLPIANQQVSLWGAQYEMGFTCGQTIDRSGTDGTAVVRAFALDLAKYLDPNFSNYEQMRSAMVFVNPIDNVQVVVKVPFEEWADGYALVVVEDVPSIAVTAPSQVYKNAYFNVYGTITNADGKVSAASAAKSAPARSVFKTALLWKRSFVKGSWSSWTQVKSVLVDGKGSVKFTKIAIKTTTQFQIRGKAFSLGGKTIQVRLKAR
jgi:hypothetical protein